MKESHKLNAQETNTEETTNLLFDGSFFGFWTEFIFFCFGAVTLLRDNDLGLEQRENHTDDLG